MESGPSGVDPLWGSFMPAVVGCVEQCVAWHQSQGFVHRNRSIGIRFRLAFQLPDRVDADRGAFS